MLGGNRLTERPDAQVIYCASSATYTKACEVFTDDCFAVVGYDVENDDISALNGRNVVVIDTDSAHPLLVKLAGAVKVQSISTPMPVEKPAEGWVQWAITNKTVYWPLPRSAAQANPSSGFPSPQLGEPDAADTPETAFQPITDDFSPEHIGEPPEHVLEGPEPDLTLIDGKPYDLSMNWRVSTKHQWPHPQNPFGIAIKPPEFDTAVFTGPLSFLDSHCADISELKGTDYGIAAMAALSSLSAWVHESWRLQVKSKDSTWQESARIWGFVCGDSSDGKSVALNLGTKPARDLDTLAGKEGAVKLAKYASDKRVFDQQQSDYEKKKAKGDAGTQPLPVEKIEIDKRYFKEANIEGLRGLLETTPKGWLYTDEMSAWVASMGKYSASKDAALGERSQWMQAWDGGAYPILRASKPIIIDSWSACILGGVTPSSLRSSLGSGKLQADGLIQRFMILNTRNQRADRDEEQNQEALATMTKVLAKLRETRPDRDMPLKLSPNAYQYFREFIEKVQSLAASGTYSGACQSGILKFRSHAVRLALVLHLTMRCATDTECAAGEYVDFQILKMACDICEQLLPHTIYFWEHVLNDGEAEFNSDVQSVCEVIACWWLGDGTEPLSELTVPLQQILNSCKKLKVKTPADAPRLARAISGACDMGWLDDSPMAKNARYGCGLKTLYRVNPKLYELWNEHDYIVNARVRRLETPNNIGTSANQTLRAVS